MRSGIEQARLLADRLQLLPRPAAVYTSTLARARQTAHAYADRVGIDVIERDDLCEWFGGEWEEKDFEEIFAEHPEAIELFRNQNPAWHLAPGSEAGEAFQDRCVTAVEDIIATHPAGDVIVVAHGGVINAYFAHILKIADQDMFFLPENTSLNTVVIRGDERLAWFLSDASHLTDPGWFAPRLCRRRRCGGGGGLNGVAAYTRAQPNADRKESITVSVQFLSTEWAEALKAHLNGNDAFKQAAQGQNATIQQVITGGDGETQLLDPDRRRRHRHGGRRRREPRRHDHAELRDRGGAGQERTLARSPPS